MSSEAAEPMSFGAAETDGAYSILADTIPAGHSAPAFHVHPRTDEAFYVASGEHTCLLGDREIKVTEGGFVFIPRGNSHTAWNSGDAPNAWDDRGLARSRGAPLRARVDHLTWPLSRCVASAALREEHRRGAAHRRCRFCLAGALVPSSRQRSSCC